MTLAVCAALTGTAQADVVLRFTQTLQTDAKAQIEVYCAPGRIAARFLGPQAMTQPRYVYRADLGVLWAILPMWKAYIQQDSVTEIAERVDKNSRQAVEERILAHPPSERAQAMAEEQALAAALRQAALLRFADSGQRDSVAGVDCAVWVATGTAAEATSGDGQASRWRDEVCIASWSAIGAGEGAPDAVLDMSRTFDRWWDGTPVRGGVAVVIRGLRALGGCPLRLRHYVDGALAAEYVFTRATVREVPPETYDVPAGFERREH